MTLSGSHRPAFVTLLVCGVAAAVAFRLGAPLRKPVPALTAVAISPDGRFLIAGERQGRVVVWRAGSWKRTAEFEHSGGGLNTLAFSPDSGFLAIAGNSLRLWRTRDWKMVLTLGTTGAVYGTARFNSDGKLLATVNASERIELWSTATGRLVRTICCMALYGDVAFSPDGRSLATAGHWPRLWGLATGCELRRLVHTREPTSAAVAFRPDGRLLATGSQDGKVRLWDVATGLPLAQSRTQRNYVETVAFDPGGTMLAYGVRNGAAWLWDPLTGVERSLGGETTTNVAFSADGRWLAFGAAGGAVHVWSLAEAREAVLPAFQE